MPDLEELHLYQQPEGYFAANPPPEEELEKFYSEKYYKEDCATYRHEYSDEEIESSLGTVRKVIKIWRELFKQKPRNCLELGCGEGWGLRVFQEEGWEVAGVDYTNYACSVHNPELVDKVIEGNAYAILPELIKLATGFQVIYLDNLLEHVHDPVQLLRYCRELIKPDGALVIEVPNACSRFYKYQYDQGRIGWYIGFAKYPDHLAYFNIDSLRATCDVAGFEEVAILDVGNYNYNINGTAFEVEEYLETQPLDKALRYYAARAGVGMGPEMLGYWRPK